METQINIAEILKGCPKGMELDCPMYKNVTLLEVADCDLYPIRIKTKSGFISELTKFGQNIHNDDAKCVIFPKGKTTWEGFVPPCQFKDGDIVMLRDSSGLLVACIYKERKNTISFNHHIALYKGGLGIVVNGEIVLTNDKLCLATEEEKVKLFQAIKDNGYKWNEETKTLEKLTPNKFDINTLKPFEKVLVRGGVGQKWTHDFFGFMDKDKGIPFVCVGYYIIQCIPYEGNEHLLGTANDCDDFYKTWE